METVYLVGSEQVQSAAHRMVEAAHEMKSAASHIDTALTQHQVFLDEWLSRFERVLLDLAERGLR